jgi:hypothetical protein
VRGEAGDGALWRDAAGGFGERGHAGCGGERLPIPRVLTSTAESITGWYFGVDWSATDYLPGTWLHVRTLVFTARPPHGSGRHQ